MVKGVQYVTAALLSEMGVKHGWFMRQGGVSEGLFASLNGKKGIGDPDANVDENRRRALAVLCHPEQVMAKSKGLSLGSNQTLSRASDEKLVYIKHEFKSGILKAKGAGEYENYDAVYSAKKGVVLSQTTADCASVIIADTNHKVVALVHGSWHTLKAELICDVVAKIKQEPGVGELVAGIGPMICKKCYEFGEEAKDLFDATYITLVADRSEQNEQSKILRDAHDDKGDDIKYLVDLKLMVIDQLKESGITKIDDVNICTKEDVRFFSHRRSGPNSGRMITLAQK